MVEILQRLVLDTGHVAATMPRGHPDVDITIRPHAAKVRIQRLALSDPAMSAAPAPLVDWTLKPNHTSGTDPIRYWLGPTEQLIVSNTMASRMLLEKIRQWTTPGVEFLTDVSSAIAVLRVRGPRASALLATDCTLDLEGADLAFGRCAQTTFAQSSVLIHRLAGFDGWDLYVERPALQFVHHWLQRGVARPADQ